MADLTKIEDRIAEMEEYIGVSAENNLAEFVANDIEKLDSKCNMIEDFARALDNDNLLFKKMFAKYDQLESYMKNGNKFASQCLDLGKKSAHVRNSIEHIGDFAKKLKEVQHLEQYLNFQPLIGKCLLQVTPSRAKTKDCAA